MIEFRVKPFGSWAVNNATSGHSDSWHKPSRVPLLSQMKLAMCALQRKPILDVSHTGMRRSVGKKNSKIFQTSLLCLIIHSVILGAVWRFPLQQVINRHAPLRGGIIIDFRSCLDVDSLNFLGQIQHIISLLLGDLRLKNRTEKTIPNPSPEPGK